MKKNIQLFALLLTSILVLTGCGKGGGESHGLNEPEPVGTAAQNGVGGAAVKGLISGAMVTVVDANGDAVPGAEATSAADGSYLIQFTATNTPIPQPIQVIVDGTGATAVCDTDNAGSSDDCMNADGTYVAFGSTHTLPSGFEMRAVLGILPDPVVGGVEATVYANPFTEMATAMALAGGSTLTAEAATEASATVLGVVQILYPTIDVNAELAAGGFRLNSIPVPDITDLENAGTGTISALSYAMAAIAGSYVAMVDPNDADYSDLNQVIVTTGAAFTAGVTNGDLGTIGAAAAGVFDTIVDELGAISGVALPAGLTLVDLGDIGDAAAAQAALLNSDPTGVPDIPDICECSDL